MNKHFIEEGILKAEKYVKRCFNSLETRDHIKNNSSYHFIPIWQNFERWLFPPLQRDVGIDTLLCLLVVQTATAIWRITWYS